MGLLALAKARVDQNTWKSIQNLLNVMMNQGCMNQHSYGSAVTALRLVHRFDLALDLFEETCRWVWGGCSCSEIRDNSSFSWMAVQLT